MSAVVHHGDCRAVMAAMAERGETVHACVTDPPYHIGFMGKRWDGGDVAFRAVLIEREAEYVADINRRIARMRGGDTPLLAGAAS